MNAQDFYETFKDSLDYLGPGFRQMHAIEMFIENGDLHMVCGDRECVVLMPKQGEHHAT